MPRLPAPPSSRPPLAAPLSFARGTFLRGQIIKVFFRYIAVQICDDNKHQSDDIEKTQHICKKGNEILKIAIQKIMKIGKFISSFQVSLLFHYQHNLWRKIFKGLAKITKNKNEHMSLNGNSEAECRC